MRTRTWVSAAVVLALVGGGAAVWMKTAGGKSAEKPAGPPPLEFVAREVTLPQRTAMPERIEFSGPLVAPQTAIVRAKAAGTLLVLDVAEGSRVKAGQVLGRMDLSELASRVAERDAQLAAAKATLVQAQRTHESNERLAQQKFISPIALENSRAALDTARGAYDAAAAARDTVRTTMREAALVAPISGIVAKRHAVPGEKLAAEQQLLTIVDIRELELAGSVGTHEVGKLKPGMTAEVRVEGLTEPFSGRIARISPAAEAGTRSIGVTIALDNPGERLRAGQYAVAGVTLKDSAERLTLPVEAVARVGGEDHVWVIENGVLARRAVKLGRRDAASGRVELLSGVPDKATVLAMRFDNLREGAKARVASGGAGGAGSVASAAASAPARVE
ncbi:efflux RND transporter periplasmic adaptor subunit [Rubrivivax gelatinosus]|uniref:efflux RND transporter periplasmic adaptor subunit n=1 Tax=Rubrivivax gelatinosus TaxID=28068 RepID=UPI001A2FF996|nr:efflux RND transporter periplasmic adaptor subunit [Rubrivivax gelatinosus]MBG6081535.1 RND family efflux transporter MFP subunit [Rubrivivax gelatinosus]